MDPFEQAKNIMFLIAGLYLPPLGYLYLDLVSTSLFLWCSTLPIVARPHSCPRAISLSKPYSRLSPRIPEVRRTPCRARGGKKEEWIF